MVEIQKLDLELLESPEFWEKAWAQAREESIFSKKNKTLHDTVDHWNRRAEDFTENVMGEKGKERVNKIIHHILCRFQSHHFFRLFGKVQGKRTGSCTNF